MLLYLHQICIKLFYAIETMLCIYIRLICIKMDRTEFMLKKSTIR